ncbi:hypothetical protein EZV62_002857 [Acer yangbiense]|uniref:Uncharacterized protein n=1 Tax=Acer yangbiense TaxID=1000413 RepID=A0A5C7IYS3_9ROSI|nr:hypothetical protein EZV62_002857 [Acer yangbiense]
MVEDGKTVQENGHGIQCNKCPESCVSRGLLAVVKRLQASAFAASTGISVHQLHHVSGPSALVDYTPYDQKLQKQFGGLNLEEEEVNSNPMEKKPENNEFANREGYSYSDYRHACDY